MSLFGPPHMCETFIDKMANMQSFSQYSQGVCLEKQIRKIELQQCHLQSSLQ
eukprot:NODE_12197_length_285_cov_7.228814_g11284_i0.p2 GENE.NODE_12197_length_285_cov_7.228814_g11284_i0~~NODE_12197_length_285_cov_7.228814_g11284_i0.p2  ORF type:complete len:62 (+),score=7.18 NODE_12197_length_285_cov_7.228814_g11284_i0:33-188(+)